MKVYLLITDGDSIEVSAYATRELAEKDAASIMRDELGDDDTRESFDKILSESGFEEAEAVYEDCLAAGSLYVRVAEAEVQG